MAPPVKRNAINRLELIKGQLNLTPSTMSLDAPKDMAEERAAASFGIEALSHAWSGGRDKYELRVIIFSYCRKRECISYPFFFFLICSKKLIILLKMILN